ncbi:rhomboid family intramembrane serine protease [Natrarchaeobius oligotrophus]|uniref:Rhomboid family intramembrane serine protease n=1 Tax=Natrarchaeobius chitinivorans TaxID=1679083 RepID=A0A3N6M655_NATCH|nr:rhomboid family intramembrane serine protease [Natrarchaeobius chitinivorans]RQG97627.1 rhomboid family intramembrane serine protease [Natrarchaeobius chitinivorans]
MLSVALAAVIVLALVASVAVVNRLDRSDRRWRDVARARFVLGVPWGTLVVIGFVLCVYLFVQGGRSNLYDPVTIPYRAWSYFYPLGMLTSSFSHASFGHLVGNLIATVAIAPLAEYVWGHYPDDGSDLPWWRANPWMRALVLFPAAVLGIGVTTSLFSLGPVIGFSGLVYAFAGFAIVRYPIATLIATIGLQPALSTLYRSLRTPVFVYVAEARPPSSPSWAEIAIQGHALGFFIGLVLGLALLERRGARPSAIRIWLAVLLFAFSKGLWQIYWFGEGNAYLLFQGPGVVIVATLAIVIALAVSGPDGPAIPRRLLERIGGSSIGVDPPAIRPLELAGGGRGDDGTADRLERIRDIVAGGGRGRSSRLSTISARGSAFAVVLVVLAVLAGVAVPVNLLVLDGEGEADRPSIQVEDYTIEYAEGVEHQLVSGIGVEAIEDDGGLVADGVIVSSERRNLWIEAVTARQLEFSGSETVTVGGPGWRETVHVERAGWTPTDNATVYQVWLWQDGDDRRLAFESNESTAELVIDNHTVSVVPDEGSFALEVTSLETGADASASIPGENETTEAGGLAFERYDRTVYASSNGTAVPVATEETYN